jgi:hypothetical protein
VSAEKAEDAVAGEELEDVEDEDEATDARVVEDSKDGGDDGDEVNPGDAADARDAVTTEDEVKPGDARIAARVEESAETGDTAEPMGVTSLDAEIDAIFIRKLPRTLHEQSVRGR